MTAPCNERFGDLGREAILHQRNALEKQMAAWRRQLGDAVSTWPDDARSKYAAMSQAWFRLGLARDELDERSVAQG